MTNYDWASRDFGTDVFTLPERPRIGVYYIAVYGSV